MKVQLRLTDTEVEVLDDLLDKLTEPWTEHPSILELIGLTKTKRSKLFHIFEKVRASWRKIETARKGA